MTMMPQRFPCKCSSIGKCLFAFLMMIGSSFLTFVSASEVSFNRDIRPLLSDRCFHCHGPDEAQRKGDLRLDTAEGAMRDHDGVRAVVPGSPDQSELIQRIFTSDPDDVMPPPDSDAALSPAERELFRAWIQNGAEYETHWSFVAPVQPPVPEVALQDWVRQPIDAFVLRRLELEGVSPSEEAGKENLIRRVTLDLTGLPPTPKEVDAFLQDRSTNAYERLVDRLLQSSRYGERMALDWLNAARYADTNGYQNDQERQMWIWRNWVIDAYNQNKPFDEFTIEQIAGDMLPDATISQIIASGFNRNHRINGEGGVIPEEYRVEYVIDRVETTGAIWLGLTVGCARCHSHKFDPVSQKEFYSLFAYFNNVPENGRDGNRGNATPTISVPVPGMEVKVSAVEQRVEALEATLALNTPEFLEAFESWKNQTNADIQSQQLNPTWQSATVLSAESTGDVVFQLLEDGSRLTTGPNPANPTYTVVLKPGQGTLTGIRLETLTHPELTDNGLARSVNGNFVLTEFEVMEKKPGTNEPHPVKIASAQASYSQGNYPIENTIDGQSNTGWAIYGRPNIVDTSAVFTLSEPIEVVEGTQFIIRMRHDANFNQHAVGRFRLSLTSALKPALDGKEGFSEAILAALNAGEEMTDDQHLLLMEHYRQMSPINAPVREQLAKAKKDLEQVRKQATTTVMVMEEMEKRRPAYFLNRGQYDQPREEVFPGIPVSLGKLPEGAPNNRLGLARWLVANDNPLTARVTVNRYWQMYFGTGLVKTADDFGAQGEFPSHPDLLDYLATEFIRSGWDVKAMQRMIVTSATYRQSSAVSESLFKLDPENRLLARGPRFRLRAEAIRDQALAISGLLEEKQGGPSVKPYQPSGLWEEVAYDKNMRYVRGTGDDLYRRSMYTFWKRAVAPPTMVIFDAGGRERCDVARRATNTPLQALATLNDVQFVEAASFLGERMIREGGSSDVERLTYGWRLAVTRQPDAMELSVLQKSLTHYLDHYRNHPEEAKALTQIGEKEHEPSDAAELSAYTAIANVLLNLDETITRE